MKSIFYLLLMSASLWSSTLNELIAYALEHSTLSKTSHTDIALSQLERKASRAVQYGELTLVADATHYNSERTLAPLSPSSISGGTPITTTKDLFSAGLSYTLPLFTGFAQTRQIEIDSLSSEMAHITAKLTREQLVYNIRSLYLTALALEERFKAQQQYTAALQRLSEQIAYEVDIGKKATIDLLKAQADLHAAQTQEAVLASNIATTKASLSAVVNKKVTTLSSVAIKVKAPDIVLNTLYSNVPTLSKVMLENKSLHKAERALKKAAASKLPQLNLNAYLGKNYGEDIATNRWDDETLYQVGLTLRYNLIDFGKRDIAVEKAALAKMKAALHKEQTLLDLKKNLTQANATLQRNYSQYLGFQTQWQLSQQSERIEQVRYDNDVSTLNDLLLAKGKTYLAKAQLIESKYNYQNSLYYIDYLMEQGVTE